MTVSRWFLVFFGLLGIWLAGGCRGGNAEPTAAEVDEPYFRQGQRQVKQERTQEALASFLKVIEQRGEKSSPESHLEAGLIYLKHSKDPIEAYHHFRQYLAQQGPNSQQAARVAELILTAKKEFARTLPGQPLENQTQRMEYLDQLEKLQRENRELKAEIAALNSGANTTVVKTVRGPANAAAPPIRANTPATVPVTPVEDDSPMKPAPMPTRPLVLDAPPSIANAPRPNSGGRAPPLRPGANVPPTAARRHTVAPSEGLYAIARKYYGPANANAAKIREIYEANRDVMKNENDLRPGMELKIP
ncbi:MAG: LysM peptidoglycan-binding domain-containing protein [Opitutaceae bacterium]